MVNWNFDNFLFQIQKHDVIHHHLSLYLRELGCVGGKMPSFKNQRAQKWKTSWSLGQSSRFKSDNGTCLQIRFWSILRPSHFVQVVRSSNRYPNQCQIILKFADRYDPRTNRSLYPPNLDTGCKFEPARPQWVSKLWFRWKINRIHSS